MVVIFIAFVFAGILVAGTDINADPQIQEDLNTLSVFPTVHTSETWGILSFIGTPFEYFGALFRVWAYQSPVLDGGYGLIQLFTTTPIAIAAVAMIIMGMVWLFRPA